MKKIIFSFVLFNLLYVVILGIGNEYPPFYGLEKMLVPIVDGNIEFFFLICTYSWILLFIYEIIKMLDEMFGLYAYIYTRSTPKKLYIYYIKKILSTITVFFLTKITVDLLWSNFEGYLNFDKFLLFSISEFLTLFIWGMLVELLFLKIQKQKEAFFLSTTFIFFIEFLALKIDFFGVFALASVGFVKNFNFFISIKIIMAIILLLVGMIQFKKTEFLGGGMND